MNKIFYDFETTGLNKWYDIPLDGAFILTDENLNKLDEFSFKVALPDGVIPSPIGLLVNNASLKEIYKGSSLYETMTKLYTKCQSWGPACFIGHNSIKFDEAFMRMGFYKSMVNTYLTNTNGNTRADLLPILHCVKKLSPNAITFPETEEGKPIFKLDQIAPINNLSHKAHDSMGDVIVTIKLAKMIMDRCPTIWQSAMACSSKLSVMAKAESMTAFCYGTYNMKREPDFGVYSLIGFNPNKKHSSEMLVFDLTHDPKAFEDASMEDMKKLVRSKDSPFRIIKVNESPILLPSSYASLITGEDHDEKFYLDRALQLKDSFNLRANAIYGLEKTNKSYAPSDILEKRIYSGFFGDDDKNLMHDFHEGFWEDKVQYIKHFKDERLKEIGNLIIFHEKPEELPEEIRNKIAVMLAKRVTNSNSKEWRTVDQALKEITSARDKFLFDEDKLKGLERFIISLSKKHNQMIKENL